MKILAFTFEAPNRRYGGGIGIMQSLASLCSFADVTYIGPFFTESEFSEIKLADKVFLREVTSIPLKAVNVLRGVTARYYQAWKEVVSYIDPSDYDIVFIDFSYNDFIEEWARSNGLETIVRVHNIEQDMSLNSAHGGQRDKYWLRNNLNAGRIIARERRCMQNCGRLVFLTELDKSRAMELYGVEIEKKASVVPVCVDMPLCSQEVVSDFGEYALVTGSLFYGPNAEGIGWLITEVWPRVIADEEVDDLGLVVAGKRPTAELKRMIANAERCTLVDSPEDMAPYFRGASLYLAPIFSGAGMKVKVAEALSYGLQVVGTRHAFIGYNEASTALFEAETARDFASSIKSAKTNAGARKADVQALHKSLFTLDRSARDFESIVRELI